jgi:hypothetical protein
MAAMSGRRMVDVEAAYCRVVEELTRLYLSDIDDPVARQALAASSVVRRTTLSLLAAMLPEVSPQDAYDHLLALAFVETRKPNVGASSSQILRYCCSVASLRLKLMIWIYE